MNRWLPLFFLGLALSARADNGTPVAHDDASQPAYGSGWTSGSNGGSGFSAWNLKTLTGTGNSNAGFYVASASDHPDLKGAAKDGKAFGLYANGITFESAAAFRGFTMPVSLGQSIEVTWETGAFEKKFDTDSTGTGSVGVTLRTGNEGNGIDDYNKGARFEFGVYSGTANYQIYDGQADHDTGVPFSEGGVKLKFTLTNLDSYDLEVTTLADGRTKVLSGRKLGGTAGAPIDSVCIFDRNWEKNDAYFNDLEVLSFAAPNGSPSAMGSPALPTPPGAAGTPAGL